MKTFLCQLFLASTVLASGLANAQSAAVIEGVQMPAWVERDGRKMPVLPGMQLKAGDKLTTGAGSRLQVRLAEGSVVKLGENGSLQLKELEPSKTLFKAALGVLEGAFRFTTDLAAKNRRRDVSISVATVNDQVRAAGYGAEIFPAMAGEKRIYVVRINGLPSRAEAQALADQLKGKYGVAAPKVSSS